MSPRKTRRATMKENPGNTPVETSAKKARASKRIKKSDGDENITDLSNLEISIKPIKKTRNGKKRKPRPDISESDSADERQVQSNDEQITGNEDTSYSKRVTRSARPKLEKTKPSITSKGKKTKNDLCVTPKSSPITNISLSPNRSTKTPRRSPENISSPKSHSTGKKAMSRVFRRLDVDHSPSTDGSDATNENSSTSKVKKNKEQTNKEDVDILSDISNTSLDKKGSPFENKELSINLVPVDLKENSSTKKSSGKKVRIAASNLISKVKSSKFKRTPVRLNKAANLRRSLVAKKDLNESSLMHLSDVFDSDASMFNGSFNLLSDKSISKKPKSPMNSTYEVNEPKTPAFQKTAEKRASKVRFATPNRKVLPSVTLNRVKTPGHVVRKTSIKNQDLSSLSVEKSVKQTSNSESSVKKSAVKKIPNFADIHKKNFNKMESLVELKNRVKIRHEILNSVEKKGVRPRKLLKDEKPSNPQNENYTRFGFKIRKETAKSLVSKTKPNKTNLREGIRSGLQGVRTNKRFELLMQARNKKK